MVKTQKSTVSPNVKEGDVLVYKNGVYVADMEATIKRREEVLRRINRIKNKA